VYELPRRKRRGTWPKPRKDWWNAADTLPMYRYQLPMSGATLVHLPQITRAQWEQSGWPDRPHP
jgi:hypothetical protein